MSKIIGLKAVKEQEKHLNTDIILALVDLKNIAKTIEQHLKINEDGQQNTDSRG